jgi:hypothetical protein
MKPLCIIFSLAALLLAGCCDLAIPVRICDGNAVPAAAPQECGPVYPGEACLPTKPFDDTKAFFDGLFCDPETP